MRPILFLAVVCIPAAAPAHERTPLFPRLHARLHPQPCPCVPVCPPVAVAEPEPIPPKKVGSPEFHPFVTLTGRVAWPDGKALPNLAPLRIVPGLGPVLPNHQIVDPGTRGVKNVIVWLRPDNTDRAKTFPLSRIEPSLLSPELQLHTVGVKGGQYEPRVLAARGGDRLQFRNTAPVGINLNYSSDVESMNILLKPAQAVALKNPLEVQRTPIAFKCDIHPWMAGRVRVFDHPYYATTDKDGKFEIKDAPVGKWRIVYWHEDGFHKGKDGILGFPIEIKGDKATLELDPIKLELPAPPK